VSLLVWCEAHPNYRGVRPPLADCEACNVLGRTNAPSGITTTKWVN
jgi:hypothetical protein